MENNEHHSIGDGVENHHQIGDSILDTFSMDNISRHALDFADKNPYTTAGLVGGAGLAGAIALAPELTVAGLGVGAGELVGMAGYGDALMDATNIGRAGYSLASLMGVV